MKWKDGQEREDGERTGALISQAARAALEWITVVPISQSVSLSVKSV